MQAINLFTLRADNKRFNNKTIKYYPQTKEAKVGRTMYDVSFNMHQPNRDKGDYSVLQASLGNAKYMVLTKKTVGKKGEHICGTCIRKWEVIK